MKLWKVTITGDIGYDQFDSFVVSADSEEEAVELLKKEYPPNAGWQDVPWGNGYTVVQLDSRTPRGIVLGSFNAG